MAPMTRALQRKIIQTDGGLGTPVFPLIEASSGAGGSSLPVPTPGTTTTARIVSLHIGCGISDTMVDSRHKQTYDYLSEIVDELFDQIAIRLDITSAVRLAACSKDFYRQVARRRCPNDVCWKLVAYHKVHDHKIACPHCPCPCTEPGYEFAAPLPTLLTHLKEAHSIEVHSFHYNKVLRYKSQPVPAQGSPRIQIIGSGDDGTVFAVQFDTRNNETLVSIVCVRSAMCLSPRYKLRLWSRFRVDGGKIYPARCARWPAVQWKVDQEEEEEEEKEEWEWKERIQMVSFWREFEPMSNASPEEDGKHMAMDWEMMSLEPLQAMDYYLSIVKIDKMDLQYKLIRVCWT